MKVHIIIGSTGAYEESAEWSVVGSLNHNDACAHADVLAGWIADNGIPGDSTTPSPVRELPSGSPDPKLQEYWRRYGVEYSVETVDLLEN